MNNEINIGSIYSLNTNKDNLVMVIEKREDSLEYGSPYLVAELIQVSEDRKEIRFKKGETLHLIIKSFPEYWTEIA